MIADKLIKSFYMIEVTGSAIERIFDRDFKIKRVVIGSKDIVSDLEATDLLQQGIETLTTGLDLTDVTENISFNPEFFPLLEDAKLTEEQKLLRIDFAIAEDEMTEQLKNQNKMAIVMSKVFDSLGDYVASRWELESPSFKITGKVGVNPDAYIQQKVLDKNDTQLSLLKFNTSNNMVVH